MMQQVSKATNGMQANAARQHRGSAGGGGDDDDDMWEHGPVLQV